MSETGKLPKGASKWWNKPINELTPKQRDIKRQYARELYKKKRSPSLADYKQQLSDLEEKNQFLQSIIENYGIDLRKLFDNNMTNTIQRVSTQESPKDPIAFNKRDYLQLVNSNELPIFLAREGQASDAFIIFAATGAKFVKVRHPIPKCTCRLGGPVPTIEQIDTDQNKLVLKISQYADCIFGIHTPGNIIAVTVELQEPDQEPESYPCSQFKKSHCKFDPPLIHPRRKEMRIIVIFDNSLRLDKWTPDPIAEMECGFMTNDARVEFLNIDTTLEFARELLQDQIK